MHGRGKAPGFGFGEMVQLASITVVHVSKKLIPLEEKFLPAKILPFLMLETFVSRSFLKVFTLLLRVSTLSMSDIGSPIPLVGDSPVA